jgi:hypothetical protein
MKTKINYFIVLFLLTCLLGSNALAQDNQKLAQSGFQFLSVVSDARGAAMAEAMTGLQAGSSALFFNPAGMAEMTTFIDVTASVNNWIADINHNTFTLAISPAQGNYGVIGFSLQSVDYGEFFGTQVNQATPLGYDDMGTFKLSALAVGMGYAKQLTDRFSVGGQVRWVQQDLGNSMIPLIGQLDDVSGLDTSRAQKSNKLSPLVFDFGTQFKTGIKSLVFGMSVRNFSKEVKYVEEGFQAPLVFNLGLSMNMFDLLQELPLDQALFLSVDACHHRDHPEQVKVGFEYKVMNLLSLRGGYVSNNDESGVTYGIGISQFGFTFDYAYTPFGIFDKVHRMTARFAM